MTFRTPLLFLLFLTLSVCSCNTRKVKHSGFEDLVVGSYTINLYNNKEFDFELGLGKHEGTYHISNDTVYLAYYDCESDKMPDKLIITDSCFYTIDNNEQNSIQIKRIK